MPLPQRLHKAGPIVEYLNSLAESPSPNIKAQARDAAIAVKQCLATPQGQILLDLIEKATVHHFLPPDADIRACDALNAQRFIALDLRRIERGEIQLDGQADAGTRRGGRR